MLPSATSGWLTLLGALPRTVKQNQAGGGEAGSAPQETSPVDSEGRTEAAQERGNCHAWLLHNGVCTQQVQQAAEKEERACACAVSGSADPGLFSLSSEPHSLEIDTL